MDTQHIERLFGRIMERLDWQEQLLEEISHRQREAQPAEDPAAIKCLNGERLYDNQDLCMMLQVSKRTLQRYRSIGALPYKTLGKKTYYSEADVLTFLSEHVKDFRKEDIAFYKARIHNFFNK